MKFHNPGVVAALLALSLMGLPSVQMTASSADFDNATNAEVDGDAAGSRDAAVVLPWEGVYDARFDSTSDVDWFTLDIAADGPICVSLRVLGKTGGVAGIAQLSAVADLRFVANDDFQRTREAAMSFLLPQGTATYFGFAPAQDSSPGKYTFRVETFERPELVGENAAGTDAGNERETALYMPAGCIAGGINGPGGDPVDWFKFNVQEGDALVLAIHATDAALPATLVDPNGNDVATVSGVDVERVTAHTTGTWFLRVGESGTGTTNDGMTTNAVGEDEYEISLTEDSPCRPVCIGGD